jgi:hypothetical protein
MSTKTKFWIAGLMVIVMGLVLARAISGIYAANPILQLALYLAGVIIAMAGLAIILFGIRRK